MSTEQPEGFANNWAYLKTELNWLDRVLMLAVARQRKDTKEIERLARSHADRATSHWWQGLVSLEGDIAHDDYRKPAEVSGLKGGYQQQLEAKIQASYQQGIALSLPKLRDRLRLSVFEKNLILLGLAPEVNRRYARLYRYLQGDDAPNRTDLPTVDLVLRLFCRSDQEWRAARNRLNPAAPLLQYRLLRVTDDRADSFLNQTVKLSAALVEYLLAEQPSPEALEGLLQPVPLLSAYALPAPKQPPAFSSYLPQVDQSKLVLPAPLLAQLQYLTQRSRHQAQIDETWGFAEQAGHSHQPGTVTLLAGPSGTGKTTAIEAIAQALQMPLTVVDLETVVPEDYRTLLEDLSLAAPRILLIQAAHYWLGRKSCLDATEVYQFLHHCHQRLGLTFLSVPQPLTVMRRWQRQIDQVLTFPTPDREARHQLWQQAFPPQLPLADDLDWQRLAKVPLTGGQIGAIAREAAFLMAIADDTQLHMQHCLQALAQAGIPANKLPKL